MTIDTKQLKKLVSMYVHAHEPYAQAQEKHRVRAVDLKEQLGSLFNTPKHEDGRANVFVNSLATLRKLDADHPLTKNVINILTLMDDRYSSMLLDSFMDEYGISAVIDQVKRPDFDFKTFIITLDDKYMAQTSNQLSKLKVEHITFEGTLTKAMVFADVIANLVNSGHLVLSETDKYQLPNTIADMVAPGKHQQYAELQQRINNAVDVQSANLMM